MMLIIKLPNVLNAFQLKFWIKKHAENHVRQTNSLIGIALLALTVLTRAHHALIPKHAQHAMKCSIILLQMDFAHINVISLLRFGTLLLNNAIH